MFVFVFASSTNCRTTNPRGQHVDGGATIWGGVTGLLFSTLKGSCCITRRSEQFWFWAMIPGGLLFRAFASELLANPVVKMDCRLAGLMESAAPWGEITTLDGRKSGKYILDESCCCRLLEPLVWARCRAGLKMMDAMAPSFANFLTRRLHRTPARGVRVDIAFMDRTKYWGRVFDSRHWTSRKSRWMTMGRQARQMGMGEAWAVMTRSWLWLWSWSRCAMPQEGFLGSRAEMGGWCRGIGFDVQMVTKESKVSDGHRERDGHVRLKWRLVLALVLVLVHSMLRRRRRDWHGWRQEEYLRHVGRRSICGIIRRLNTATYELM
ncbi:hypothetical protein VFPPC_00302 [Pochonia chlamydosporia 170]|uniref:Uncharacterized protein n=1 Tax=Pochonia chlamydosporia 170 TaxID=1380566 RepID=A0A179G335_METCM|nr:hypothetical protein VFPPC_00302 [Pochonia chlamydosporia 170]OAQ72292.1 hypothetical protein VFPPC_00302 [Pochonia chlamydosporia 170]